MGYGEVGGGGSVEMRMLDKDKKEKAKGTDPDPKRKDGGNFQVVVNGALVSTVPIDFDNARQILIVWPPHRWENGQIVDAQGNVVTDQTGISS